MRDFLLGIFSTIFQMDMSDPHEIPFAMPLMMGAILGLVIGFIILSMIDTERKQQLLEQRNDEPDASNKNSH